MIFDCVIKKVPSLNYLYLKIPTLIRLVLNGIPLAELEKIETLGKYTKPIEELYLSQTKYDLIPEHNLKYEPIDKNIHMLNYNFIL